MNNKYLRIVLGLPLFMALFTGCSQADEYQGITDDGAEKRLLGVTLLAAPATTPQTRAATVTALPTDSEVGFFLQAAAPDYAAVNNTKGVYKADESLWLPTDSIWLTGVAAKLAVYYPYDAAQTTAGKLNLKAAVRTDDAKDLWSTRFEANNRTKDIKLTLTQLYSRLSFTFVKLADAEYTGTSALTQLKLEGAGIYDGATFAVIDSTYVYATAGYTAVLTDVIIAGIDPTAVDATKVDLLLPPYGTLTGDLTLTATVDTKEMKITIPKAKLSNTLAPGKQYNITVKLKPTALVLSSVKTTDWDSQTAWNEEAEFVPIIPPIDLGLPFVIASGNLLAASNGSGGYTYSFAEDQGYYSGDGSSGDYYCWNTLNPNLTDETQSAWDNARDACQQVDDGKWYTPSIEQWKSMLDKGTVWGTYAAGSGTKSGYYIGTTSVPPESKRNKFLFLPAAGGRYGGDSWNNVNTGGNYWSSTSSSFSASTLYFSNTSINEETGNDRYYAFPLRCIKDKPKPTPDHAIDLGLDFYIADGNVNATKQADGTYEYTFANEQGYYGGNGSQTEYFSWNTLEPIGWAEQSSWDDARDVCRKIGDGQWYTPTQAQFQALMDAGNVWGENIYTMKNGTKVNGSYFGISTVPSEADQDKSVFLPAAGYRSNTNWDNATISGRYWSSTPNGSNAYLLLFHSGSCEIPFYYPAESFSIRCVRNK